MENIKIGDFVKIIKRRDYDFMDTIYLQVLKVYDIMKNQNGETFVELMADDYLIQLDNYLKYKGVIGFTLDEIELSNEGSIIQGRLENIQYKKKELNNRIKLLQMDIDELEYEKDLLLNHDNSSFIRTTDHKGFVEYTLIDFQ